MQKIPKLLQKQIDKYFNLQIGSKSVVCPYYINPKVMVGNLRVMAGKGSPREIEHETKVWAKVKGFDLKKATSKEIRKFMIETHIGIDCSGFISQVLSLYLKENNLPPLIKLLKFKNNNLGSKIRRFLRPIENIGAKTLTSKANTVEIKDLNDISAGDLIRAKGKQRNAFHVAMIVEVKRNSAGEIQIFEYVNSHRYYEDQNGVRYGKVEITDPDGELKKQNWLDELNGRNYFLEDLLVDYEDNGIRRLRFADEIGLY
ncbi:hypothetical protein GF362_02360 [Candidatus Dojkabacteria bacterium]|nr:hypothetical protein [Candidatus Dojkabacteria bacterium]